MAVHSDLAAQGSSLGQCPFCPFPAGEMNDAGEVLLTIYERVMGVSRAAAAAVDAIFGLSVSEHVQCSSCRKVTQQSSYTQYFYNTQVGGGVAGSPFGDASCVLQPMRAFQVVPHRSGEHFLRMALNQQPACAAALLCRQAAALQLAHGMYPHLESMGQLFKFLESQHLKTCDEVSVA